MNLKFLFKCIVYIGIAISLNGKEISRTEQLRIITYNIRYDAKVDSAKGWGWNDRKAELCNSLKLLSPDVLCIQEGLINQLSYVEGALSGYKYVGVGRDDGKEGGEYCAIFYKIQKFELLEKGNFWLSETPDIPGKKGWDAACTRIVSWANLKSISSGKVFFVFNTHFDHQGVIARKESALLLLKKIKEITGGLSFLLTGDFNSTPEEEPIKIIEYPEEYDVNGLNGLQNAYKSASNIKTGPTYTYTGFEVCGNEKKVQIDYIFTKKGINIINYYVLAQSINQYYLSDHLPVVADIDL